MRRHAKAPSAGSTKRQPRAPRLLALALAVAALALLLLAPLAQAKVVVGAFGPTGTQGGQFGGGSKQIAINNSGAGGVPAGTIYVTDTNSHRVQRLNANGGFQRAWGFDVDSSNPSTGFEICTVAANCQQGSVAAVNANGGQVNEPQGIAVSQTTGHVFVTDNGNRRVEEFDADGNFVRSWGESVVEGGATGTGDLNATTTIANVKATSKEFVVGQPITSSDGGIPAGTTVTNVTTGASTTITLSQAATTTAPGVTLSVATGTGNVAANEKQTINLANPTAGTFTLTVPARQGFAAQTTGSIAFNAPPNDTVAGTPGVIDSVQEALENLTTIGTGNVAVTGPNGGPFVVEFKGPLADTNVAQLTAASSGFTVGIGSQLNCTGGPASATLSFQWLANGASLGAANGAQTSTYTVQPADAGKAIQCQVTAINASSGAVQVSTASVIPPTPSPAPPTPPASIAAPTVTGALTVGSTPSGVTLTCAAGAWSGAPTSYTYQWYRNGQPLGSPTTTPSTSNVYTVQTADLATAASFQCGVTGTNAGGAETRFSANRTTSPAPSGPAAPTAASTLVLPAATVATTADGALAFEVCGAPSGCKNAAAAGTNGGQFGSSMRSLVLDASNNVWVSDTTNRRLEKFDASGNFIAAYGYGVNGGSALESCTSVAVGVCKASTQGSGPGQFGSFSPFFFAFDSAGNLYANNGGNMRVERFAAPGMTSVTTFASLPTLVNSSAMLALPADHFLVTLNCVQAQGNACVASPPPPASEPTENRLLELDSSGNPVETSLVGAGFSQITGMARNSATGKIYVAANTNNPAANIVVINDGAAAPDPVMTLNAITTKADSTATFSGTVDPQGSTINTCNFQYSTNQSTWTSLPVANCSSLAPGGGAQAVSVNATGLVPNTKYFVRLAVTRLFIGGTALSSVQSFTTDSAAPAVSNVGAITPTDRSLRMVGTIDTRNSGTAGYVFQYGTTPALGSSTAPVSLANSGSPVIVSQVVEGLEPGTTYYLRLVATNLTGTTSSATKTAATRATALPLPENRSYEMVSPPEKNGGGALSGSQAAFAVAYDGQAVGFCTTSMFGDPSPPLSLITNACANYASHRGASGWQTVNALPSYCGGHYSNAFQSIRLSLNLDFAAISQPESADCPLPPLDPAAPLTGNTNLYRERLTSGAYNYELLAPTDSGSTSAYRGSSEDFSHVVYLSKTNQTSPPDSPAPGNFEKLYEWANGVLRLVSKDTSGTPFTTASDIAGSAQAGADSANGVSSSGDRIFFQNPVDPVSGCVASNCELYLRQGGTATYDVSQSECSPACSNPSGADVFRYALPDGSKAFFTTSAQLTNDDTSATGTDLYMFTQSANPATDLHNLTLLSQDNEPADGTDASALEVLGTSDDGDTVFFVANNQIVLGAPTASGPKVYRWRWNGGSPSVEYLATLSSGDAIKNWSGIRFRSVTSDGAYLLVNSTVAIDPVADSDLNRDFYRWDQQGGWTCISCQAPGIASAGDVEGVRPAGFAQLSAWRKISMSDDGERVFFTTPDALLPADTNGSGGCPKVGDGALLACWDVYEWHDGTISLISAGTGGPSYLMGASHDGTDVFIYTEDKLTGWDTDYAGDIYDARIGGGFPEPPPTGAPCDVNSGACEGAPSVAPPPAPAASAAFEGPGNPVAKPKPKPHKHKKHKHAKKKQRQHRAAKHNRRAAR